MGSIGSPSSISPPADEGKPVESVCLVDQWPMGSVGSPSSISPPADEGKSVESVRLVDQLRQLPEAFGRIQGLRMLDVSRNQLVPDGGGGRARDVGALVRARRPCALQRELAASGVYSQWRSSRVSAMEGSSPHLMSIRGRGILPVSTMKGRSPASADWGRPSGVR
jgi:hypothetical protein